MPALAVTLDLPCRPSYRAVPGPERPQCGQSSRTGGRVVVWQAAPRPEWVLAVNSGLIEPIADEAAQPLARDGLLREALARDGSAGAGLEAFGGEQFLE